MKGSKETKITVEMSIGEADVLARCIDRMMSNEDYRDLLPDSKSTKRTLIDLFDVLRILV